MTSTDVRLLVVFAHELTKPFFFCQEVRSFVRSFVRLLFLCTCRTRSANPSLVVIANASRDSRELHDFKMNGRTTQSIQKKRDEMYFHLIARIILK